MMPNSRTFLLGIPRMAEKRRATLEHLRERGIDAELFDGIDYQVSGLCTQWPFDIGKPGDREIIEPKTVSLYLTHLMAWKTCVHLSGSAFVFFEDDVRFSEDWKEHWEAALPFLPECWDILYIGSCCTSYNRHQSQIRNRLYEVQYALCTHAYAVSGKGLSLLIEACQRVCAPLDIAMALSVKVPIRRFAILPRIASQLDTALPV